MAYVNLEHEPWRSGMTYAEEQKYFDGLVDKILKFNKQQNAMLLEKPADRIAWRPEYNDMVTTYLTPKEIGNLKAEGYDKNTIARIAEHELYEDVLKQFVKTTGKKDFASPEDRWFFREQVYEKERLLRVAEGLALKDRYRQKNPAEWEYPDLVAEKNKKREEERRKIEANKAAGAKPETGNEASSFTTSDNDKSAVSSVLAAKVKQGGR